MWKREQSRGMKRKEAVRAKVLTSAISVTMGEKCLDCSVENVATDKRRLLEGICHRPYIIC